MRNLLSERGNPHSELLDFTSNLLRRFHYFYRQIQTNPEAKRSIRGRSRPALSGASHGDGAPWLQLFLTARAQSQSDRKAGVGGGVLADRRLEVTGIGPRQQTRVVHEEDELRRRETLGLRAARLGCVKQLQPL